MGAFLLEVVAPVLRIRRTEQLLPALVITVRTCACPLRHLLLLLVLRHECFLAQIRLRLIGRSTMVTGVPSLTPVTSVALLRF